MTGKRERQITPVGPRAIDRSKGRAVVPAGAVAAIEAQSGNKKRGVKERLLPGETVVSFLSKMVGTAVLPTAVVVGVGKKAGVLAGTEVEVEKKMKGRDARMALELKEIGKRANDVLDDETMLAGLGIEEVGVDSRNTALTSTELSSLIEPPYPTEHDLARRVVAVSLRGGVAGQVLDGVVNSSDFAGLVAAGRSTVSSTVLARINQKLGSGDEELELLRVGRKDSLVLAFTVGSQGGFEAPMLIGGARVLFRPPATRLDEEDKRRVIVVMKGGEATEIGYPAEIAIDEFVPDTVENLKLVVRDGSVLGIPQRVLPKFVRRRLKFELDDDLSQGLARSFAGDSGVPRIGGIVLGNVQGTVQDVIPVVDIDVAKRVLFKAISGIAMAENLRERSEDTLKGFGDPQSAYDVTVTTGRPRRATVEALVDDTFRRERERQTAADFLSMSFADQADYLRRKKWSYTRANVRKAVYEAKRVLEDSVKR
ncbi:hypothetical protein KKA02_04790 [Patescibacteria group bacterium]|nr:hypothetical protein [Patescibacteria group bacterium]